MSAKFLMIVVLVSLLAAYAPKEEIPAAVLPAGKAFTDGKEIFFVHTEDSDETLMNVYAFDNGLEGTGGKR